MTGRSTFLISTTTVRDSKRCRFLGGRPRAGRANYRRHDGVDWSSVNRACKDRGVLARAAASSSVVACKLRPDGVAAWLFLVRSCRRRLIGVRRVQHGTTSANLQLMRGTVRPPRREFFNGVLPPSRRAEQSPLEFVR